MRASEFVSETWSAKYKRSIDCSHPKGFSQRAHCAGRKKNEDVTQYQVVCDGTKKGIFTDLDRAIANAKSMFKHEKEYYHIAVVNLDTGKEEWSWSAPERDAALNEFAPSSDDNRENNPEDVLFRFAKMWYSAPDVSTQRRVEQALAKIGWDIGELESEEGGAYVMQTGDDAGDSYIAWSEEQLADQLNELSFLGSPCTKDCSGHRAGYEWSQRKGGVDAASWSNSFNNGAALFKNGY